MIKPRLVLSFLPLVSWSFTSVLFGQTSGPTQTEYQSYGHKEVTEMVNLFTGDLNYNIPLFELPGPDGTYPFILTYNSGVSMNQEASWVGLGWNLSPGVISRQLRGIPDDFNGEEITLKQDQAPDVTVSLSAGNGIGLEAFGINLGFGQKVNLSLNSYKGVNLSYDLSRSLSMNGNFGDHLSAGFASRFNAGFSTESGSTLSGNLNAGLIFKEAEGIFNIGTSLSASRNSLQGMQTLQLGISAGVKIVNSLDPDIQKEDKNYQGSGLNVTTGSLYKSVSLGTQSYTPTIRKSENSWQLLGRVTYGAEINGLYPNAEFDGSITYRDLKEKETSQTAYGYLYHHLAKDEDNVVIDFNRENETLLTDATKYLAMPHATYDLYNVSGSGMGGTFRAYRNDIIPEKPDPNQINSDGISLGGELGGGRYAHIGLNIGYSASKSISGNWNGHALEPITSSSASAGNLLYEPYYFKFIGEHTRSFEHDKFRALGKDAPLEIGIGDIGSTNYRAAFERAIRDVALPSVSLDIISELRDFGQSLIDIFPTYLENLSGGSEMEGKLISNNSLDYFNQLKGYLEEQKASGSREPRKTLIQSFTNKEIRSFKGSIKELEVDYKVWEDQPDLTSYLTSAKIPLARHDNDQIGAFIITNPNGVRYIYALPAINRKTIDYTASVGVLDRCDRTVDIENGNSYKVSGSEQFKQETTVPEYAFAWQLTQILGPDYVDLTDDGPTDDDLGYWMSFKYTKVNSAYKWRAPFSQANALIGVENSFNLSDDKGSLRYGEKEIWYLSEIRSKTHQAEFHHSPRTDGRGAQQIFQNVDTKGGYLHQLDSITVKAIGNQLPIKQIHFGYANRLVPGTPNAATGKLTLDSLYFTYQGSERGRWSPYQFHYGKDNPAYNLDNQDRWGMYREAESPCLANSFPYTLQGEENRDQVNNWAAVWHLDSLQMPSGGTVKIDYEADTYGYVQDQPAMQMSSIVRLFEHIDRDFSNKDTNQNKIFFKLNSPSHAVDSMVLKYIKGIEFLYFKARMQLKTEEDDLQEYISGYMQIDTVLYENEDRYYGVQDGLGWVKIKFIGTGKEYHPISIAAWEYMRSRQPELIYKNNRINIPPIDLTPTPSEILNTFETAASELLGSINLRNFGAFFNSYYEQCDNQKWGKIVDLDEAWIRLNHPTHNKLGGGVRVKRITMADNWEYADNDTNQLAKRSIGIEFNYDHPEGGSSGVATYEPMVGNEENSLRSIKDIQRNEVFLGSDYFTTTESPLNESQYPGPSVGYGRVEVTTTKTRKVLDDPNLRFPTTGVTVHEFYTAKDSPISSAETSLNPKKRSSNFLESLFAQEKLYSASQGFSIVINDWHGKPRSSSQYATNNGIVGDQPLFEEIYQYTQRPTFLETELQLSFSKDGNTGTRRLTGIAIDSFSQDLVKSDLYLSSERSRTASMSLGLPGNIEVIPDAVFQAVPLPLPFLFLTKDQAFSETRVASANKVVNKTHLLQTTLTYKDGVMESNKQLGYDAISGSPIFSAIENNFGDTIYQLNYPAYWIYDRMGPAFVNAGAEFPIHEITPIGDNLYKGVIRGFGRDLKLVLLPGDEIVFIDDNDTANKLYITGHLSLDGHAAGYISSFEFYSAKELDVNAKGSAKIIRSGNRNQLLPTAASISSLSNPLHSFDEKTLTYETEALRIEEVPGTPTVPITLEPDLKTVVQWAKGQLSPEEAKTAIGRSFGPPERLAMTAGYLVSRKLIGKDRYFALLDTDGNSVSLAIIKLPFRLYLERSISGHPAGAINTLRGGIKLFHSGIYVRQGSQVYYLTASRDSDALLEPSIGKKLLSTPVVQSCTLKTLDSVIGATLSTYRDTWLYPRLYHPQLQEVEGLFPMPTNLAAGYRYGLLGIFRPSEQYEWVSERTYSPNAPILRTDGLIDNFHWSLCSKCEDNWILNQYISQYDPYGFAQETNNSLNIPGASLYGYKASLNIAYANNAGYREIGFESFEEYGLQHALSRNEADYSSKLGNGNIDFYTQNGRYEVGIDDRVIPKDRFRQFNTLENGIVIKEKLNPTTQYLIDKKIPANEIIFTTGIEKLQLTISDMELLETGELFLEIQDTSQLSRISNQPPYGELQLGWAARLSELFQEVEAETDLDAVALIASEEAHTGEQSLRISKKMTYRQERLKIVPDQRYVLSAWVKVSGAPSERTTYASNGDLGIAVDFVDLFGHSVLAENAVIFREPNGPIIDGWQKIEFEFETNQPTATRIDVSLVNYAYTGSNSPKVYFDDVRIHPINAVMETYVYDKSNYRLTGSLDNNNFATYYGYDEEGNLQSVQKETLRGRKTIQEIRAHVNERR